jgi:arsenate reductase (thioredoxin)
MRQVLFVCVHNSGRSQMAEAFFNRSAGGLAKAISAGTEPAARVNPMVAAVMQETGIDISSHFPKKLTFEMMEGVERVITMGCGGDKSCPASFVPTEDWALEDPEGKPADMIRSIRDEIKSKVDKLIEEMALKRDFRKS